MTSELSEAEAYYTHQGSSRYKSTIHAQGAWNEQEQHMAVASGVLCYELENFLPREGMRIARINFDILGMIPAGDFEIVTTMVRPGKTIELVQAEFQASGRTAIRATAWRLATSDTSAISGTSESAMPPLVDCAPFEAMSMWPGGFIRSVDIRVAPGWAPGAGKVWIRSSYPTVLGEQTSALTKLVGVIDTANGIAPRINPAEGEYIYPNTDLSIHLHRIPTGEWLGLDTNVTFGDSGIGLTSSVLHDETGPIGRAEQILTIRKR